MPSVTGSDLAAKRNLGVCVYCGSKSGSDPRYVAEARKLGVGLGAAGLRLIFGAGDAGLMGEVARSCREAGGATFGVIPRGLFEREDARRELPEVVVTADLHHRKALMLENADAVAVLPGGVGTLDEFVEAITWRQLDIHRKPIVLIDVDGFWAPLLEMFDRMRAAGFLHPPMVHDSFDLADGAEAAVEILRRRLEVSP